MINFQFFSGRLTADPQLRFTGSGTAVAEFSIAQSDSKKDERGEWQTTNQLFLPCVVWRELAETIANTLHKGDSVAVLGRPVTRSWEAKDGTRRSRVELQVNEVYQQLRPARPQQNQSSGWGTPAPTGEQRGGFGGGSDEPPF